MDGSIEPPFLIGTTCGSCHIAFDPLNPPKDPTHPQWENLKGAIGNQYLRISQMMVSGMPVNSLEWQIFTHARPGTSDTSAIPTDQVNNPGTMNAIINTHRRPTFANEEVIKWRKASTCAKGESEDKCWCEPGREGKCWQRSTQKETVHHILKGGEDSIGALEAIQRVYFNIGSCSEQCWVNHLTDLRQMDPAMRNFGQTPFDIGQCRRDCSELPRDRGPPARDLLAFLSSGETNATDLHAARANARKATNPKAKYEYDDLVADLDREFGRGAVTRGREVFAENCARCHSSLPEAEAGPFASRDFRAIDDEDRTARRLDGQRRVHAGHRSGHVPLPRAAQQSHGRSRVAGVRLGDAARAQARSEHQGAGRRRARLLPQHLAAVGLGARAVHAQQRDGARTVRRQRRRRHGLLSRRRTWMRRASCSRLRSSPPAGPTTPASRVASSSTRNRCGNC